MNCNAVYRCLNNPTLTLQTVTFMLLLNSLDGYTQVTWGRENSSKSICHVWIYYIKISFLYGRHVWYQRSWFLFCSHGSMIWLDLVMVVQMMVVSRLSWAEKLMLCLFAFYRKGLRSCIKYQISLQTWPYRKIKLHSNF